MCSTYSLDDSTRCLQAQDRIAENERLKAEQQQLLRRLDKLQKLTGVSGEGEFDGRSPEEVRGHHDSGLRAEIRCCSLHYLLLQHHLLHEETRDI